jgi:NADPH:quinone reductase-like Zn-dependent oxidoreductase
MKAWFLIEAGASNNKTVVDRTFPLSEVAAAHRLMETSQHIGKILLTM